MMVICPSSFPSAAGAQEPGRTSTTVGGPFVQACVALLLYESPATLPDTLLATAAGEHRLLHPLRLFARLFDGNHGVRPFAHKVLLQSGQYRQHAKDHLARRGGRVDLLR
jgi:hypothetical protein